MIKSIVTLDCGQIAYPNYNNNAISRLDFTWTFKYVREQACSDKQADAGIFTTKN